MKNILFLLGLCLLMSSSWQAASGNQTNVLDPFLEEDDDFEEDFPSIVSLKFHLKEELLAELFSEIALKNFYCNFSDCDISLIDISEATQLSRYSSKDLADAIKKLDISSTDFYNILILYPVSAADVENLLQTFQLTFSELYKSFLDTLDNPSKTIPEILTALNVSVMDFMNAIAYGNDTIRLQVLATGNYSQANLETFLKLSNKTGYDILDLVPLNKVFKNIKSLNSQDFTNFVKNLGITSSKLSNFYKHLNITAINFISYPPFIRIVTDYYGFLNSEDALGVFISNTEVYTSNKAKALSVYVNQNVEVVKRYAAFHAELVENPLVQYDVENVTLINSKYETGEIALVKVKNSFSTVYSNVSNKFDPSELRNCTYVSKVPFGLISERVIDAKLFDYSIIIPKSNTTIFTLGSPLFCRERLYGLATEETAGFIKLSALMKKKLPDTSPTVAESESSSTSLLSYNVFYMLFVCIIVSLLLF